MQWFAFIFILSIISSSAQIFLGENQIFARVDSTSFLRNLVGDTPFFGVPVSIGIINEQIFFVNRGFIRGGEVDSILWSFKVNDKEILQRRTSVSPNEDFLLEVGLGLENTSYVNGTQTIPFEFFRYRKRGQVLYSIEILEPNMKVIPEQLEPARVFQISSFQSVLPLLFIIFLAMVSRNVYLAMFFGIWLGSTIIAEGNILVGFKDLFDAHLIPSVTNIYNFTAIISTFFLGGLLALIQRAGGQEGFSYHVSRFATTPKKTQLAAVCTGVGLCFDDYSSVLIIGAAFKRLMDGFHVSREKLAFVADATSAPIVSIAPLSSWIAFELSLIKEELEGIRRNSNFDTKNDLPGDYPFFLSTIPSRYYQFLILTVQLTLILSSVEFGPMLFVERKARLHKRQDGGDGRMEVAADHDLTQPEEDTPKRAWNFFIPLGFLLISLMVSLINLGLKSIDEQNENLPPNAEIEKILREILGNTNSFQALLLSIFGSSLFALLFYFIQFKHNGKIILPTLTGIQQALDLGVPSKNRNESVINKSKGRPLISFVEGINVWVEGLRNFAPAILVLCLAFTIKSIVTGLATDRLFADIIISSDFDARALPTVIFIVSALLAVATGTSFGTISIMYPLVSFASFESSRGNIDLLTTSLASIMAGAVFGDHVSPISDTTILASIGAGCKIGTHVYTQLPYALWAAIFSLLLGTLPVGYGANAIAMLLISMLVISICTILVSAPIVAQNAKLDFFSELFFKHFHPGYLEKMRHQMKEFARDNPDMVTKDPLAVIFNFLTKYGTRDKYTEEIVQEVRYQEVTL